MRTKKQMAVVNYYQWSVTRWFTSPTREALDAAGRGIYRELLDVCYAQGTIPSDHVLLARMCRASGEEFERAWIVIGRHFKKHPKNTLELINSHASTYRNSYSAYIREQKIRGTVGGSRKGKRKSLEINDVGSDGLSDGLEISKPPLKPILNLTKLNYTELNSTPSPPPNPPTAAATFDPNEPDRQQLATALIDTLIQTHPQPGNRATAIAVAERVLANAADPGAVCEEITEVHQEYLEFWSEERTRNPRAFIPQLPRWLADGDYLHAPAKLAAPTAAPKGPKAQQMERILHGHS